MKKSHAFLNRDDLLPFTCVHNYTIDDTRLSDKALSVLTFLLRQHPDARINLDKVCDRFAYTPRILRKIMRELRDLGYAKLHSVKDKDGIWVGSCYEIFRSGSSFPSQPKNGVSAGRYGESIVPILNNTIPPSKVGGIKSELSLEFKKSSLPDTEAGNLCKLYYAFVSKNRLFMTVARRGRMVTIKPQFKNWLAGAEWLLDRVNADQIQEVMQWYFQNYTSPYLTTHMSFANWCNNFDAIRKAMYRQQRRNPDSEEKTKVTVSYEE